MTATNPAPGKSANKNGAQKTKTKTPMSQAHKDALAEGRTHGKVVTNYLNALEDHKPRRGRKVTPESIREQITKLEVKIHEASGAERLNLIQRKFDLEAQLRRTADTDNLSELESQFVKVAKPYAERKGITYAAWREVGVPPTVLKDAGIERKAS